MKRNTLHLGVFIDAFGWELLQQYPFLNDTLKVKAPLESVLGYSSTCIPTILTGKLPRDHGHFGFYRYDPDHSPFGLIWQTMRALPEPLASRGRVRHWISRIMKWHLGWNGYFQIYNVPFRHLDLFDYTEKRDIYQPDGINNGHPTLFDAFRTRGKALHVSDWRRPEEENLKALHSVLAEGKVDFAYLYLASMDALLHAEGTDSTAIPDKIEWYDRQLQSVIQAAESRYEDLHLYIFSDHGMADVHETSDLMLRVNALGLTFGRDYAAVYDSTMARFWFLNREAKDKILDVLDGEQRGHVLSDRELAALGCDFADEEFGELFFLMKPGVLLCPSFMNARPIAGMHGYHPEDKDSWAMFASNVPLESTPQRLDDIHDFLLSRVIQ